MQLVGYHAGTHILSILIVSLGAGVACWLECRTRDRKVCQFESRQERRDDFLLRSQLCVLILFRCPFHPRVTAVARKRPRSFCKKCRWRVTPKHAYTLTHRSRSGLTMPLSRQSVGIYQEASSHATRQGTLDHSRLNSLNHCGLMVA